MSNAIEKCQALVGELKLTREGTSSLFFGVYHGFPICLTIIDEPAALGLAFQVRHHVAQKSLPPIELRLGPVLADLMERKKAQVLVEGRIASFDLYDAAELVEQNRVAKLLDIVLEQFSRLNLDKGVELCAVCKREFVVVGPFKGVLAEQKCPPCQELEQKEAAAKVAFNPLNLPFVASLGCLAALAGAVVWALVWIGYDLVFTLLHTDKLSVPNLLMAFVSLGIAFLVSQPIGYIMSKIPGRGDRIAGWFGAGFALVAVVLGELLYLTWLLHRGSGVINVTAAARLLWVSHQVFPFGYLSGKLLVTAVTLSFAYIRSRPGAKPLTLFALTPGPEAKA